ncbi:hypothetical protein GTQ99_17580 [Kineococcus sp. T13]|uniref:hypothetical protein n=1 Tax=Kineococcus vitellinus TaxID=2696565 RepID=UPI001412689F|nr:hypothetical protein [Kineococcus vitellinus]NAZ77220.1 hypothetical protein [Kineococcus vitellinus]
MTTHRSSTTRTTAGSTTAGTTRRSARHLRRLLAIGLAAGVSGTGLATAAQAAPTTVSAGERTPAPVAAALSPAALPVDVAAVDGAQRRSSLVTVVL